MKMRLHITLATLLTTFLISCGSKEEKKEGFSYERKTEPKSKKLRLKQLLLEPQ